MEQVAHHAVVYDRVARIGQHLPGRPQRAQQAGLDSSGVVEEFGSACRPARILLVPSVAIRVTVGKYDAVAFRRYDFRYEIPSRIPLVTGERVATVAQSVEHDGRVHIPARVV